MQVKPIKTAEDNRAALARIEQLWGAKPNTAE
ncbi:DNA-binding protein, partial [Vibrio anguillarum]|nr:DNA-binding protein [Vibrio anguillarum]